MSDWIQQATAEIVLRTNASGAEEIERIIRQFALPLPAPGGEKPPGVGTDNPCAVDAAIQGWLDVAHPKPLTPAAIDVERVCPTCGEFSNTAKDMELRTARQSIQRLTAALEKISTGFQTIRTTADGGWVPVYTAAAAERFSVIARDALLGKPDAEIDAVEAGERGGE